MNRWILSLLGVSLALGAWAGAVHAADVRPGDQFKIKLNAVFNAMIAHSGDGFAITVPDGFQSDPKGKPEIPPGTPGSAFFELGDKSPEVIKYDLTKVVLTIEGAKVEIKTKIAAGDAHAGTISVMKASTFKKAFIPPIVGLFIWKDTAKLPAGKEIVLEAAAAKHW